MVTSKHPAIWARPRLSSNLLCDHLASLFSHATVLLPKHAPLFGDHAFCASCENTLRGFGHMTSATEVDCAAFEHTQPHSLCCGDFGKQDLDRRPKFFSETHRWKEDRKRSVIFEQHRHSWERSPRQSSQRNAWGCPLSTRIGSNIIAERALEFVRLAGLQTDKRNQLRRTTFQSRRHRASSLPTLKSHLPAIVPCARCYRLIDLDQPSRPCGALLVQRLRLP